MPNLNDYENPTEDMECETFARWLELMKLPHTHIGNESGRGRTAMLRTAKLKRMGQSPGFPDYLVVIPTKFTVVDDDAIPNTYSIIGEWLDDMPLPIVYGKRMVAIEMKRRKGGTLSANQKMWLEILNNAGVESVACKGFDEAKKFIEDRM